MDLEKDHGTPGIALGKRGNGQRQRSENNNWMGILT